MVKARSSITSTALPAPTPYFIIEGSAGPGLLGISSDCSHCTLQTGWTEKDEDDGPRLHQWGSWFFSAFSTLSESCPWTLLIFIGIKADVHMLVYISGKVKNQGLDKSHDPWLNMYLWWGGFPSLTSSATLCEKERWLIHRYVHEKGLVGILWKKISLC